MEQNQHNNILHGNRAKMTGNGIHSPRFTNYVFPTAGALGGLSVENMERAYFNSENNIPRIDDAVEYAKREVEHNIK